jgi:hypothetical protein
MAYHEKVINTGLFCFNEAFSCMRSDLSGVTTSIPAGGAAFHEISTQKPDEKNRTELEAERAEGNFAYEQPAYEQLRVSNELKKTGRLRVPRRSKKKRYTERSRENMRAMREIAGE